VHEHLLSRGDLSREERHRAQHALALDFLKAGLLDRAEEALRKLEGSAYEAQAQLALLAIYERTRDWPNAAEIAKKLESSGHGQFTGRQAHYLCEQAATAAPQKAEQLLHEAMTIAPEAARPGIDLAALQRRAGDAQAAFATLATLAQSAPASIPLMARQIADTAIAANRRGEATQILRSAYERAPSLDVLEAIVALEPDTTSAREWYLKHLERESSLVAASKWLAAEKLEHEQFHPMVQGALDHAARPLMRYRCAACGFEAKQHFWQCPGCQAWDSYPARRVEEL
jgi:lipopolysaccharide biosynthesis regulator YciM